MIYILATSTVLLALTCAALTWVLRDAAKEINDLIRDMRRQQEIIRDLLNSEVTG
jgi:uncharacterized membrane protein YqjE